MPEARAHGTPDTQLYWVRLTPQFTGSGRSVKSSRTARIGQAHTSEECRYLRGSRAAQSLVTQVALSEEAVNLIGICRECRGLIPHVLTDKARAASIKAQWPHGSMGSLEYHRPRKAWMARAYVSGKRVELKWSKHKAVVEQALKEFRERKQAQEAQTE